MYNIIINYIINNNTNINNVNKIPFISSHIWPWGNQFNS